MSIIFCLLINICHLTLHIELIAVQRVACILTFRGTALNGSSAVDYFKDSTVIVSLKFVFLLKSEVFKVLLFLASLTWRKLDQTTHFHSK